MRGTVILHGIRWKTTTTLDDLDFCDDVALLCSTKEQISLVKKLQNLQEQAGTVGLKNNTPNTKTVKINAENHDKVKVDGQVIRDIDEFIYLVQRSVRKKEA